MLGTYKLQNYYYANAIIIPDFHFHFFFFLVCILSLRQHAIGLGIFVNNEPSLMIFSHNVYIAILYTMEPTNFMWGWGGGQGGQKSLI